MRGVWKHVDPGWSPGWVTRLRAQCLCSCLASVSAREMGWRRLPGPSGVGWGREALHCVDTPLLGGDLSLGPLH